MASEGPAATALRGVQGAGRSRSDPGIAHPPRDRGRLRGSPGQMAPWKKPVLGELPQVFSTRRAKAAQDEAALEATLDQPIGQLRSSSTG